MQKSGLQRRRVNVQPSFTAFFSVIDMMDAAVDVPTNRRWAPPPTYLYASRVDADMVGHVHLCSPSMFIPCIGVQLGPLKMN